MCYHPDPMNALSAAALSDEADVPPPTDNGRIPAHLVPAIRASSHTLRYRLFALMSVWFAYVLAMPWLIIHTSGAAALLIPTLGVFLVSFLGYYRHELWHNYFPGLYNPTWFNFVSYMLFSDPAVYRIAHPAHHKYVHTTQDIEFFCEDYETDRPRRKRQFVLELIFGNMAWELTCLHRLFRENKYTRWGSRACLAKRAALFFTLHTICRALVPGSGWLFFWCYLTTIWTGSVVTRHNQWIEHLGIVANGASIAERNLLTRNVRSGTLSGWLFNFMNHDDATEHVFHHTEPQLNTRGFAGLELPPGARTVTLSEYAGLLVDHYRSL